MDQIASEVLKGYGLPGIIILALGWVSYKLFQRNELLSEKYTALAIKTAEVIEQNTASRNQMTAVFQALKNSVDEAIIVPRRRGRNHEPD